LPEYSSRRAKHTPDPRIGKERQAAGLPFAFDLHKKLVRTFTQKQVWNQQVDEQPSATQSKATSQMLLPGVASYPSDGVLTVKTTALAEAERKIMRSAIPLTKPQALFLVSCRKEKNMCCRSELLIIFRREKSDGRDSCDSLAFLESK
jgi:hypothetical protein